MSSCVIKLTAGLSALVTSTGTGSRGTSGTSGRAEGRDVAGLTALLYARRGGPDELVRIRATIRTGTYRVAGLRGLGVGAGVGDVSGLSALVTSGSSSGGAGGGLVGG